MKPESPSLYSPTLMCMAAIASLVPEAAVAAVVVLVGLVWWCVR